MSKKYLAIGGPRAGEYLLYQDGPELHVHQRDLTRAMDDQHDDLAMATSVEVFAYRLEELHTPDGSVKCWVPVSQKPLTTFNVLLDVYARAVAAGVAG